MFKKLTIRAKLISGFILVVLFSGVASLVAVTVSQNTLQETIGAESVKSAQEILNTMERDIYMRMEEIQSYSQDLRLLSLMTNSNQEFDTLEDVTKVINQREFEWVLITKNQVTPFIQELMSNEVSRELRERLDFYRQRYGYPVFGEIFVTNKYGVNVALTGKTTDYYQADEVWWQEAQRRGVYVEDVEYDESAGVYSINISVRVEDEAGSFLGVMKAVLNIEEVINVIRESGSEEIVVTKLPRFDDDLRTPQDRQFKLIDKKGRLIYSTVEKGFVIFKDLSQELALYFREGSARCQPYFIVPADKQHQGKRLLAHAHSRGYRGYPGLGWILVVEQETKDIFAPVVRLRNALLYMSLGLLVFAFCLSLLIYRSVMGPIKELSSTVQAIAGGNIEKRVKRSSQDEIGHLAKAFNIMADELQQSQTAVEQKVIERTEQLEKLNKYMTGRELKMIKLKKEIGELRRKLEEK